jgi:hypothetical protein
MISVIEKSSEHVAGSLTRRQDIAFSLQGMFALIVVILLGGLNDC